MDTKPVSEWDKLILDLGEANAKVAAFERSNAALREALERQHAGTDAVWNEKAEIMKANAALREENAKLVAQLGRYKSMPPSSYEGQAAGGT